MILKFYQSNTALALFALPIVMLIFWAPSFLWGAELTPIENGSFLFEFFNVENVFLNKTIAFIVIFATGVLLNMSINKNELFEKNTFVPALFYVLIMSSILEMQQIHPLVFTNLFWVLAYRRLLNVYNQVQCKSEIFDASLLILIGTLFTFPSAFILMLLPWITLLVVRPFDFREYLMPIAAFILVCLYLLVYQFVFTSQLMDVEISSPYNGLQVKSNWSFYGIYAIVVIIMYLSGYHLMKKSNTSSVRFRKLTTMLLLFLSLILLIMLFEKFTQTNNTFILFGAVPFSILWSFYFFYAQKKWFASVLFYTAFIITGLNVYRVFDLF